MIEHNNYEIVKLICHLVERIRLSLILFKLRFLVLSNAVHPYQRIRQQLPVRPGIIPLGEIR